MATSKKTNIVIENTRPTLIELPSCKGMAAPPRLLPGQNDIDAAVWKECAKNHVIKKYLAAKFLVVRKDLKAAKTLLNGLDSLSDEAAAEQIAKCDDVTLLQDWMGSSQKNPIRKACQIRIEELIALQGDDTGDDS